MDKRRRAALASVLASATLAFAQDDLQQQNPIPPLPNGNDEDRRLPDGRSQSDAIARKEHEDALKDAAALVTLAQQIRDEVQKAGNYIVPVSTLKKTEEIEKLARKIRSRLKN